MSEAKRLPPIRPALLLDDDDDDDDDSILPDILPDRIGPRASRGAENPTPPGDGGQPRSGQDADWQKMRKRSFVTNRSQNN